MNEESCSLVYTGQILDGMTFERVHQNLAAVFKTDVERIKKKFSEKRSVLKRNADRAACIQMQKLLLEAGAICDIIPAEEKREAPQAPSHQAAPMDPSQSEPPADPYAAPRADLRAGPTGPGDFIAPRKRPASRGMAWFFQAVNLFLKRPLAWILIMICFFLVNLMQIVPVLGPIAFTLLGPVFLAGLILGAKDLDENNELGAGCLFQGFRQGFGQLVILGLLFLAAIAFAAVIAGGTVYAFIGLNGPEAGPPLAAILVIALFILAFFVPVMMGYWFSPALIAIHHKPVFEAISLSFRGCMKNVLPFTVFSLVAMAVTVGVFLIFGVLAALAGAGFGAMGPMAAAIIPSILMIPLMLAIMPIYILTIYTSFRDIFYQG